MPVVPSKAISRKEIGARIKRLRKEAGLRQWQLAELVGATQPAIHMYERGVLPEPKRLLELARIGGTTVEWILTGRHWETGSEEMSRVPQEIYRLAFQLRECGEEELEALETTVRIVNSAAEALRRAATEDSERVPVEEIAGSLREASGGSLQPLVAALRIHRAVAEAAVRDQAVRLRKSSFLAAGPDDASDAASRRTEGRRSPYRVRATSLEAIRGNIYRLDGSLLMIGDILKDKDLRGELEQALGRLRTKLESRKSRDTKVKKAHRSKS